MRATLRNNGEEDPVDVLDLEADVRRGRVPPDALLRHGPWTGEEFRRLDAIPQLREALDTADARFSAHIRARTRPWGTLALCLVVLSCAFAQRALGWAAQLDPAWQQAFERLYAGGAVGWDGAFLDGRWWSVWTGHLLHWGYAPLFHALANLPFLAYCGYRVEQAWGRSGLARVIAVSAAVGSAAVMLWSDQPVVGSSMIAYGLLGAQIATGFRMDQAIPAGWRGFYGWGNLVAFMMLLALNLAVELLLTGTTSGPAAGVSHLGHVSGMLGGGLAVMAGTPGVLAPAARAAAGRRADLAAAGGALLAPALLALLLPLLPPVLGFPWKETEVEGANIKLALPGMLAEHPVRLGGLTGWRGDDLSEEVIFVARAAFSSLDAQAGYDWPAWWGERLRGRAETADLGAEPLGDGWIVRSFVISDETSAEPRYYVIEHQRVQGLDVARLAWVQMADGPPELGARERMYNAVFQKAEIGDPPDLLAARESYEARPDSPQRTYEYALELLRAGQPAEAEPLLAALLARTDGWEWEAARLRLKVYADYPEVGEAAPVEWALPFLEQAPVIDLAIHGPGTAWLAKRGACEQARAHLARLEGLAASFAAENPQETDATAEIGEAVVAAEAAVAAGCAAR